MIKWGNVAIAALIGCAVVGATGYGVYWLATKEKQAPEPDTTQPRTETPKEKSDEPPTETPISKPDEPQAETPKEKTQPDEPTQPPKEKPARPEYLDRIPADAAIVGHIDFRSLWDSDPISKLRKAASEEKFTVEQTTMDAFLDWVNRTTGLDPANVRSVTGYIDPPEDNTRLLRFGLVVTTERPINKFVVSTVLKENLGKEMTEELLAFDGNRTLLFMAESERAAYLKADKPRAGTWRPLLEVIKAEEHMITAAANLDSLPRDDIMQELAGLPGVGDMLQKSKRAVVNLSLPNNRLTLDFQFETGSPADAKAVSEAMKALIAVGKALVAQMKDANSREKDIESRENMNDLLVRAEDLLEGANVSVSGSTATLTGRVELGADFAPQVLAMVQKVRSAAARMQSANNLKLLGLAMHNYHDSHLHLPPQAITDKDGKPLLSWRVAILPEIEQENLYRQFKLDEPWDSEHNKKLIPLMPQVYQVPISNPETEKTHYRIFVGNPGKSGGPVLITPFPANRKVGLSDITDGMSNTLFVVEAAEPVIWTKPEPLVCEPGKPLPQLGNHFATRRANVLLGDGSVRSIPTVNGDADMRAIISANGNETSSVLD